MFLCKDIWSIIVDYLDIDSAYHLYQTHAFFRDVVKIRKIDTFREGIMLSLLNPTDPIFSQLSSIKYSLPVKTLSQYPCLRNIKTTDINITNLTNLCLEKLDCSFSCHFLDLNHLTTLKKLDISNSLLSYSQIEKLSLEKLKISYNSVDKIWITSSLRTLIAYSCWKLSKIDFHTINLTELNIQDCPLITDVSSLTTLKKLNISGFCGVGQSGIRHLDLVRLDVSHNQKIVNLNWMKSLKYLYANGNCLTNDGIACLELEKLNIECNPNITDISFLTSLKCLSIRNIAQNNACGITSAGLRGLCLEKLNMANNLMINDISWMSGLKILNIADTYVNQENIEGLKLVELCVDHNPYVGDVTMIPTLKRLSARGERCGISQEGIVGLNLDYLDVSDNPKINNVSQMTTLKYLAIDRGCGVDQAGINGLDLISLHANDNDKIYRISWMKNLKILDISHRCNVGLSEISHLKLWRVYYHSNIHIKEVSCIKSIDYEKKIPRHCSKMLYK